MLRRFLLDGWFDFDVFVGCRGLVNAGKISQSSFSSTLGRRSCNDELHFSRWAILSVVPLLNNSSFQFSLYARLADPARPVISKSSAPGVGGGGGNGCTVRLVFSLGRL